MNTYTSDNTTRLLKATILEIQKDIKYYAQKRDSYTALVEFLIPIEDRLPDDEKIIDKFYDTYMRAFDKMQDADFMVEMLSDKLQQLQRVLYYLEDYEQY